VACFGHADSGTGKAAAPAFQQTTLRGFLVSNCPSPPKSYVLIWPLYPQYMLSMVKVKVKLPRESTC
jgi:hypothetical protein